jgi:hypothetical protein
MTRIRLVLLAVLALLLALLAGWVWGNAGRRSAETSLDATRLQLALARARADLLQARVDIFEVNFGSASRALESAKPAVRDVLSRLQQGGQEQAARRANDALVALEQAQQLAGKLDQTANARAADAVRALDDIARTVPPPR